MSVNICITLLKSIKVWMPSGCCGVNKVNMLCADMISVAEVPVSPQEDLGRKMAMVFH